MFKKTFHPILKALSKGKHLPALCLIGVIAIFTACQDINGSAADVAAGLFDRNAAVAKVQPNQTVINNQADLQAIEKNPAGAYVLGSSFAVTNWRPICDPNGVGPFTGTLDGAGYTITISSFDPNALSGGQYIGIFAQSDRGATFTNLTVNIEAGIVGPTIATYAGGIVGQAIGTNFADITVTGTFDLASSTPEGIDFYAGNVVGSAEPDTTFLNTTIKACLNVLYTSKDTTLSHPIVKAGGIAGSIVGGKFDTATVNSQITVKADMPYNPDYNVTPIADNWLAVGGVAGYAERLGFNNVTIDASTAVDAVSQHTQTYVGGILGRGLNVDINYAVSDAVVTGEGPGYNTSAGGVAGYIQQSTVRESSASGDVAASASWDSTGYDYWQIYAGGLVGYSGGTLNGGSSIDHSYASGDVIAEAVYPYAGGLVGYNYGFNDFSGSPAELRRLEAAGKVTTTYNGGIITRSWATGSVSAKATPGSGGLPYAGGLAGYSSIPTASVSAYNIENCYATGSVTSVTDGQYGWAGGLLGANAQGSVVATSYATGAVSVTTGIRPLPFSQPGINPGAAAGGIVGVNYYTNVTPKKDALITRSVALNPVIVGRSSDTSVSPYLLHRVAGDLGDPKQTYGIGVLDDNYASTAMVIIPPITIIVDPDDVDGGNAAYKPGQSFYASAPLSWNFGIWHWNAATGYPEL
jgi:hypothetical protein